MLVGKLGTPSRARACVRARVSVNIVNFRLGSFTKLAAGSTHFVKGKVGGGPPLAEGGVVRVTIGRGTEGGFCDG